MNFNMGTLKFSGRQKKNSWLKQFSYFFITVKKRMEWLGI